MTAPVDAILARLDGVRKRGPDQWSARCPAHDDRAPSLSIRELSDGRVLLHDFGGCDVEAIVGAVGLTLTDLFPPKPVAPGCGAAPERRRRLLTAGQALELLEREATVIAVAGVNVGHGIEFSDADRERVLLAAARVAHLRAEVMT